MKLKTVIPTMMLAMCCFAAQAETLSVDIELPRIDVAEYHRPYVAIWIANQDRTVAANLNVWYQQEDGPEGEGETWLKDMRQWWRRSGRSLELPIDGVSGATKVPGTHTLVFSETSDQLSSLVAGEYVLCVEAAREVGGREILRLPFKWKSGQAQTTSVTGETELGEITLKIES
ncbi:DUF2271 domain-containing protein [Hirschia maritima]|uniref:DUF2271 domain-containing protein n=1 Tax=Hirschia maritima TaxID=1121961 RepID=UPI0009D97A36|nr:DUF2271 domain-containing protein [Hirschia maritima]